MNLWQHLIRRLSVSKRITYTYVILSVIWLIASGPLFIYLQGHPYIIDFVRAAYVLVSAIVLYTLLTQQQTLQVSKAEYDHLFNTLREPIIVHRKGHIIDANQRAVQLFDANSRDDLIGKPILSIVHPAYAAEVKNRIGRLNKGVSTELLEEQFITLTGRVIDVEVLGVPARRQGKRVIEVFIRDVTIRKQHEKNLQQSEQRYRELNRLHELILASTTEGIIGIDTNGLTLFCNAAVTQLTGYDREQLLGQPIHHKLHCGNHPADCPAEQDCAMCEATRRDTVWYGKDQTLFRADGCPVPAEYVISPLVDEGAMIGAVIVFRDITERKRSEDLLLQSEKLAMAGELAAGIAHEIRNPLTALKGFLQIMNQSEDRNHYYYDIMLRELSRIESIVNEFLILAKPNTLEPELCAIGDILNDTVALLSAEAALCGAQILMEAEQIPPIRCDRNRIKQVLVNLVKNAIEAVPQDGGRVQIVAAASDVNHQVVIRITDNGSGIPEEQIARLGNPFYTTKETGTGLGLLVSQRIIRSHGGTLEVFSQVGQGTQVEIKLPIDAVTHGDVFREIAASGLEQGQ